MLFNNLAIAERENDEFIIQYRGTLSEFKHFKFYQIPWEMTFVDGHFNVGQLIMLDVIPKCGQWKIDLLGKNGDILFHFNPRFKENCVVRNSYQRGTWSNEERSGPFPFEKERGCELALRNDSHPIMYVNNECINTFVLGTMNPGKDYVRTGVYGDVEITNISVV
ncbi:unnamed protein product [Angiostrongylus costaricensis]|uniref:Galectin n=1 Tax=Angiostrongylus costaricensis TaxID=334426 RepID=A0A0R3PER6_ANGCS|nr:unnamed protein product [Angiostrongylus costaricensis]